MQRIDSDVRFQTSNDDVTVRRTPGRLSAAIYIHDLSPGGVERQSLVLARELRNRHVDVTLVVHQLRGELLPLLPAGVPVVNLDSGRTLQDVFRLRQYLRREKPDVLLANVDHNNIAASLANVLAGSGTKVIICQHNPLSAGFHATVNWKHRVVPMCYWALSSYIDHAVAVSRGISDELVHQAGLPSSKVSTIFNAVIGDDFDCRANQAIVHPWLMASDRPVFVTAGRLVEMKDHRNLLRAFALYLKTAPARLIILGTGPMLNDLRGLAGSLGILPDVDFAGFVENPLPYMRAADAFVLSSRSEGFGNVLVEAMRCGTPCVSTDCPYGPGDILGRGAYGVLVPARDPEALAGGLDRVIRQAELWPADVLRDRAGAYSYDACADAYRELFQRLARYHPLRKSSTPALVA